MGFFPGKQTASPSRKSSKKSSGGGGGSSKSSPTPLKTSPALSTAENARRMAINKSRGVGDSQGRSPSDSNFGKGPTAPSSQFRSGGGGSLKSAKVKTRVVSRAEFQRSLARKQQVSKSARKFLKPLQEERKRTGAAERRARIDAVTQKQRLIKEIKGQPLSELGRKEKQALIDYLDRQFKPFEKGKALFTPSASGKIIRNLDIQLRKKGTKEISRKFTEPKKFAKKAPSTLTAVEKKKGLAGVRQTLSKQRGIARDRSQRDKSQLSRTFQGTAVLGTLGLASGVVGVAEAIRNPVKTAKAQIEAIKQPRETIRVLGQEFIADPVGVVAEFYAFAKTVNIAGKGVKRSPAGRFVQEEIFIRSQPKEIQPAVRKIIKSARIQQKINPLNIKSIRKVNFLEVVSLNKLEAQALAKTLKNTDSVVFGSWAARTLGGKKLPKPKDVDLATADVNLFNKKFLNNIPSGSRKNYVVKGEKILRVEPGKAAPTPILDVKPIDRLIPQKSLITRRGRIPAVGYVSRVVGVERFRKVLRINKQIETLKNKLNKATTRKSRSGFKRKISKLEKQRSKEIRRFTPSELAKLKKVPSVGGLDFSTQKIITVKGIKMVGFGEQTVRKALGTLQVLIEKNIRRQKDPSSLVRALEVQRAALKRSKKLTLFKKRKLKLLGDTIRMLKSKAFAKLLEKKVPGLTKEYPLVAKISPKALKKVNFKKIEKEALDKVKIKPKGRNSESKKRKTSKAKLKKSAGKLRKITKSRRRVSKDDRIADRVISSKKRTFYHQTSPALAKKIKKEGLKPGSGQGSGFNAIFLDPKLKGRGIGSAAKGGAFLEVKLTTSQLKRIKADKGFADYPLELAVDFKIPPSQIRIIGEKVKKPSKLSSSSRRRVKNKKVSKPTSKRKRPAKRLKKRKVSKLPKKKRARPSRLPSKIKRSRPSKLRPSRLKSSKTASSRPSKVRSSRSRPSKVSKSRASNLKPSKVRPSKVSKSRASNLKPSKLKPSKLRPSRIPKSGPSRLTPSSVRSALVRLPKGVPRPPPVLLRKPKNKKMEERVIRWVKKQKQIYRPSLAAVLFNITGIPKKRLLTGFELRPILVRKKPKRKARKKPKRIKRRTTRKKKKK